MISGMRLLGVFTLSVTAAVLVGAEQRNSDGALPAPMKMLSSAAGSPLSEPSPAAPESRPTEIAVFLLRSGQPIPPSEACDVSVRVDFFADEAGARPVGPFVILQPLPGTCVCRATLPAIADGGVRSARITLIRHANGSHEELLPAVYPMDENRLKADIEVPSGV